MDEDLKKAVVIPVDAAKAALSEHGYKEFTALVNMIAGYVEKNQEQFEDTLEIIDLNTFKDK